MHGSFRRDLEVAQDAGVFRLKRKPAARLGSALLAAVSLVAGLLDLWLGHVWVAALQLALCAAFVWLLARAELESCRFEDDTLVLRTFEGVRLREVRVPAAKVRRVALAKAGGRARAWVETNNGEQYALLEGAEEHVERVADSLSRLVLLAAAEPPPSAEVLH